MWRPDLVNCCRLRRCRALRHPRHDQLRAIVVPVRALTILHHHRSGLAPWPGPDSTLESHPVLQAHSFDHRLNLRKTVETAHSRAMSAAIGKPVRRCSPARASPNRGVLGIRVNGVRAIATTGCQTAGTAVAQRQQLQRHVPRAVDGLRSVLDHREDVLDGEIVALGPSSVCRDRRVTDGRVAPADADKWCCC